VRNISVKERSLIQTPWRSSRESKEQCVVYELGEFCELKKPIKNRGPDVFCQRFSKNRCTSRLGLLRASELRELFLETEPEWRLYEQLRVADVDFTLSPGPPKLGDDEDARGR